MEQNRLYLLFDQPPGKAPTPIVREFLRFILTREGQQIVAGDAKRFIPLTASQAADARAAIGPS